MALRTKWEILEARLESLRQQVEDAENYLRWLEKTPFTANGTGVCSQCREELPTEKDFAQHFLIDDERYINLGHCPNKKV